MVLSNKKLKQRLRATMAESLVAKESTTQGGTSHSDKSFRELLGSAAPKPRLSKREKRRKISSLHDGSTNTEENNKGVTSSEVLNEKNETKKNKKRKIGGESETQGNENGISESKEKKPTTTKRAKNKKKNKKKKNKDKGIETGNAADKEEEQPMEMEQGKSTQVNADAEADADEASKVYVGGIPYYSTEEDIRSFFESCGTITEVDCVTFPETGKFRGIAMITFKTEAAAKRAIALDGADMGGLFLKIKPYKAPRAPKSSDFAPKIIEGYNRVYVGNLSWDITEDDLRSLFLACKISTIRFGEDKTTGEFRGYAHVDFTDSLSVTIALKLDQQVVCGRPVRVTCAVPKKGVAKNNTDGFKSKKADNGSLTSGGGKKRRTCYECGVPGHISSACPKKQAINPTRGGIAVKEYGVKE